ncbi:MAG: YCII-related domain, partial [Actinomycetia bacterium]|nr:YCII-related domain [Actinomycetes bacterium]
LLGFYLIEVDSLDEALDWAQRMPAHDGQVIEVRAALSGMPWQREL